MPVYRDEKLKTWYVKFRYRDWQGKGRYTTKRGFKTKRDALKYEFEFKASSTERVDLKLSRLVDIYLANKKLRVKISTYKKIESVLRNHFLPFVVNLKASELTTAIMQEWQNRLIQQKLKYSTISKIHNIVNSFINYIVKSYGLKENPLYKVNDIHSLKKREVRRINIWTHDEFDKFLECVKNPKHRICFMILFFGGLRVGELLALEKRDFNFKENTISITKNKIKATGEISTPKTPESEREVDMPEEVMKEIKQYIRNLKVVPSRSPIFDTNHSSLWLSMKKCAEKAGVKQIRIHDLRHSHASHLMYLGVSITTISGRLGHKSPKITLDIYSHMYNNSGKQAANIINNAILSKKK